MKKLSIVLLCILLAFSFVSCEKDKSGDMITNYENFMTGYKGSTNVRNLFYPLIETLKAGEVNQSLKDVDITSDLAKFVKSYLKSDDDVTIASSTTKKYTDGTVTGTFTDSSNMNLTISGVKFTVKYTLGSETDEKELAFTLNGNYEVSTNTDAKTFSAVINFTLNDETYDISYVVNYDTEKYISAKTNGSDVEVRLLNAGK